LQKLNLAKSFFGPRLRESPLRWIAYGIGVGVLSGLGAALFFAALEAGSHLTFGMLAGMPQPTPPGDTLPFELPGELASEPRRWIYFLLPALGGLLSGLLVYRFAPEAEGHGTDELLRAFHRERGRIRPRVPLVKGLATLCTLASGGSAGKEGPIAQIGAGFGSWLGGWLRLSVRDRRILLLAGAAGGLGAIFRAPLGSAITAIEVLYREDFESDALIPCVISSVTAYTLFFVLLGGARIFAVPEYRVVNPMELPGYLLLALVNVPIGILYVRIFYGTRNRIFRRLKVSRALRPMLGGLGVGLLGLWVPQAYGSGWGFIQQAIDGQMIVSVMAWVAVAKIAATSLTIGSGGSGGVFGPTLFIGGMLGGVIGYGGHAFAPELFPTPSAFVLVGMASFFAGVANAPIGAMLMVTEMTGGYGLLPPLMLVSVVAILFTRRYSIYENQVLDRFHSPAHLGDLTINVLEEMKVDDVFEPSENVATVSPATGFEAVRDLILGGREATVAVSSSAGRIVGLVTAEQIRPVMDEHQLDSFVVAGDIAAPPVVLHRDDDLYRAHQAFRASGCPQIPVVHEDRETGAQRILGMLDYRDMMRAYERELVRRREV
jgi:CIC family chloride channel protein